MGVMDWLKDQDAQARWGPQYKQRAAFNQQRQQLMLKKIMMALAVQKSQIAANQMLRYQRGTGALEDLTDIGREGEGGEFAFPPGLMDLLGPEAQAMGRSSVETGRQRGLQEFETGMEGEEALIGQRRASSNLSSGRLIEMVARLPGRMKTETAREGYYIEGAGRSRASAARSRSLTARDRQGGIAKGVMDALKEVGLQEKMRAEEAIRRGVRGPETMPRPLFSEEMRPEVERALRRMDFFRDFAEQRWDDDDESSEGIGAYDGIYDTDHYPGDYDPDALPLPEGEDDEGLLQQLMQHLGTIGMGGGQ